MRSKSRTRWTLAAVASIAVAATTVAVAATSSAPATESAKQAGCPDEGGNPRWPVKTMSDSAATNVRLKPRLTTVRALTRLAKPNGLDLATERIAGVETTVYRLRVPLVRFELENDGDIHLRIADPRDRTIQMVIEFPDTQCAPALMSPRRAAMAAARSALVKACGRPPLDNTPGTPQYLRATATITGVGFFDPVGHAAANGIELHPALSFKTTKCLKIAPPRRLQATGPDEIEAEGAGR